MSAVGLTGEMEEHNRQRILDLFHAQVGIKKIAKVVGAQETTIRSVVAKFRERADISRASPGPRDDAWCRQVRRQENEAPWFPLGIRVGTKEYLEAMENHVKPWLEAHFPDGRCVWLQDGALSLTAKMMQNWLSKSLSGQFWESTMWLPSS